MIVAMMSRRTPMTAREVAEAVNEQRLYSRRDKGAIPASQVSARARKYPHFFTRTPEGRLQLTPRALEAAPKNRVPRELPADVSDAPRYQQVQDVVSGSDALLDNAAFRAANSIDTDAPPRPGLYAIRVREIDVLPSPFREEARRRESTLIYIGAAKVNLSKRLVQELRARGHGTLFRSLGAALGYRPQPGSLIGKKNDRNFVFSPSDEGAIISWINDNLEVSWVQLEHGVHAAETRLLRLHGPLFNLQGNHRRLPALTRLRDLCRSVANSVGSDA